MENRYTMPRSITNSKGIYEHINLLWNTYKNITNDTIYLDFKATNKLDPNMMAPIGMILTKLKSNKNKILLSHLNKSIRKMLLECEFISSYTESESEISQKYIQYHNFSGDENSTFRKYILSQLIDIKDSEIVNLLISRIMEIFVNVKMHARYNINKNRYGNKEIFSSGYYCRKDNYLVFSIANNGLTFIDKISGCLKLNLEQESDYISWALQRSNSTRTKRDGPGGLGLFLLLELIKQCQGELIIVSGKGFYRFNATNYKECESLDFSCSYPGTVITVKLPIEYIYIYNMKFDYKIRLDISDLLRKVK